VLLFRVFRQLDSKLMTFAIDRGGNKPEFIAKVQFHQNFPKGGQAVVQNCRKSKTG
jgi:hypothetical protein